MRPKRSRIVTLVVLVSPLLFAACGDDDSSPPQTGSIQVTTTTSGDDLDTDGYTVAIGSDSRAIGLNGSQTFTGLTPASTSVTLSGIADNCSVAGDNPLSVNVTAGATATAAFAVQCIALAPDSFSVGGTVSGLTGAGLVLQNNGGDDEAIATDGPYVFGTDLEDGSTYAVTVSSQPAGQTCTVSNGTGTVNGADVTNVNVACTDDPTYSVGGTVTGLTGTLVLQNNGGDDETVTADGGYTFATELADGTNYAVTVLTQPDGQNCTVSNGTGTITGADVTNVDVSCADLLGNLDVTTVTGGADLDVDGYILSVGSDSQNIGINETVNLTDLPVGSYDVILSDVQSNCSVSGGSTRQVSIQDGQTASVTFNVSCNLVPGAVGKIAFASNRTGAFEIWNMNTDGTGKTQLTFFDDEARQPAYSPNGTRILFWSRHEGGADIFIMNADGSGVINLTNSGAQETDPEWCSDGTYYAYVRSTGTQLEDVWVANLAGTVRYNLTKSSTSNDRNPTWSPDCSTIAFTSDRDGLPNEEIYAVSVADVTTPSPTNLTNNTEGNQRDGRPDYSPDGSQIVFDSNRNGFSADIWVMDADGANQSVIYQNDSETDYDPKWSPDGSRIAYVKNGGAQKDIYIMNADGTNQLRLTTDGAEDESPDFSP